MQITVRNANHALSSGLHAVLSLGVERPSRNGPVIAMDEPTVITYQKPMERVVFAPERDANPFFHLFECLWMLAGRRDVASVAEFVPSMRNYSDNGRQFNAAYGHRWRKHFGVDQIEAVIAKLSAEKGRDDRRVYMSMWDPKTDNAPSLDIPCNLGVAFRCRSNGALDMTVFNRSNDLILGATGANVVHMSFLHEVVARSCELELGNYHQITNDLHLYTEQEKTAPCLPLAGSWVEENDPYVTGVVGTSPVMEGSWDEWNEDLQTFLQYGNVVGLRDRFFRRVAAPMVLAHKFYRRHTGEDRYIGTLDILEQCLASDWRRAAQEWVHRRHMAWKEKAL